MSDKKYQDPMILHKGGECLKFALGRELTDKDITNVPSHLDSFVAYFTLIGKMRRKTVSLLSLVKYANEDETDYHELHKEMSTLIINELRDHFKFGNSDELFAALDKIVIPDWVFENASLLIDLLPNIYLIKDKLYYVREKDGASLFMCGYPKYLGTDIEDNEGVVYGHSVISKIYSEIIGYDPGFSAIYLRLKNTDSIYAVYYVEQEQEVFRHSKCIGFLDDGKPILIEDGYLVADIYGTKEKIRPVDDLERYTVKDDHILVRPAPGVPQLFKPFHLMPDGSVQKSTYPEQMAYIVGMIEDDLRGHAARCGMKALAEEYSGELADFFDNNEFTPNYLSELLVSFGHPDRKVVRNYFNVCHIVGNCIGKDKDVLTLFYMLGDASRRMAEDVGPDFISETLCRELNKLYMSGELGKSIKNTNDLYNKLLTNVYWTDKMMKNRPKPAPARKGMRIGGFNFNTKRILLEGLGTTDIIVLGNLILPATCNTPGMVSYNVEAGRYEVRFKRILNEAEKLKVIEAFSLENESCRFYVDHMACDKRISKEVQRVEL